MNYNSRYYEKWSCPQRNCKERPPRQNIISIQTTKERFSFQCLLARLSELLLELNKKCLVRNKLFCTKKLYFKFLWYDFSDIVNWRNLDSIGEIDTWNHTKQSNYLQLYPPLKYTYASQIYVLYIQRALCDFKVHFI